MKDFQKIQETIKGNLSDYFSVEFLNRIDTTIVFHPLDKKAISKIVDLDLLELKQRIKQSKNMNLVYNNDIVNHIAKEVYNPEF
jgi:ATP-dependent Clp protease ATP-binding subunit ClpA